MTRSRHTRLSRRAFLFSGTAALAAGTALSQRALATPPQGTPDAATLAARAADIRSVREIKRLQHLWAHYAEAGQWEAMADLFAPDGLYESPPARAQGRAAIAAQLRADMGAGADGLSVDRLNIRLFLAPVVTLAADGRSGRGRWHEVAMTGRSGVSADWAGGIHENDYVLTGEGWRIAALRYHPQFGGPYADGWHNLARLTPMVPYHYTPDGAGLPVPRERRIAGTAPSLAALQAEADQLLAASAAQNLQAAYGFYLDRKMWDDIVDLFAPDALLDVAGLGRFTGTSGVRAMLQSRFGEAGLKTGELNDHLQLMPVVSVAADGRSAQVRNLELGMTGQNQVAGFWSLAVQNFACARGADGKWRITGLQHSPRMRCDFAKGWATPMAALGPASAAPPAASHLTEVAYPLARSLQVEVPPTLAPRLTKGRVTAPATLAAALRRAEACDGAENICSAYGYYIDEFRWSDTGDLFSRDGWKELSYVGTYVGRHRVRQSMVERYGNAGRSPVSLAIHQKTQPYVTVAPDGSQGQIRLRLWQLNTSVEGTGSWIGGIYENLFRLEDGVWKIAGMDLDYIWTADCKTGWAGIKPRAPQPFSPPEALVRRYPPDAPLRGNIFPPYPDITPMGYHYANPVSGRKPPLLLPWSDGRARQT